MADTRVLDETVIANIDGDERMYCVDDPAGTPADRYITPELLGPTRQIPYFTDSAIYLTAPMSSSGAAAAIGANQIYAYPIWVPYRRAFTTLACVVTALQGTSGIRLGLYNANKKTGQPTTLIEEPASQIDSSAGTGATGVKTLTISQTLNPGMYYLFFVSSGTPTVLRISSGDVAACLGTRFGSSSALPNQGLFRAFTYGALPTDETASSFSTMASAASGGPVIGIR